MKSRSVWFSLILLGLVAVQTGAQGQRRLIPGEITGFVQFSGTQGSMNSVTIYLEDDMGGMIQQSTPLGNGRFEFRGLPRARFRVVAKAPGYHNHTMAVDLTLVARANVVLSLQSEKTFDERKAASPAGPALVAAQSYQVPPDARREFEKGQKAAHENKIDEAVQAYRRALEIYPNFAEAYEALGTVYMDQQNWPEAEENLKKSIELNSQFASAHTALGALYNRTERAPEAVPELERSLELNPNSWQAHFELAQALLATGKAEEAEPHARRAREMEPKQPLTHLVLGNVLLRRNDLTGAKQEYHSFLAAAPDSPLAGPVRDKIAEMDRQAPRQAESPPASTIPRNAQKEFAEGKKSLDQGHPEDALGHFRKASEMHPEFVEAHHMRGTVLLDQQDWQGAEQAFRRSLELNSNYAPSHVGLGTMYNYQGKPAEAAKELELAVELDPNSWQAHFELAQTRLALRQVKEAEPHALRAHELQPKNPLVHVLLGNVYLVERRLPSARDEYQHYVELAPDGPLAGMLKDKIKAIDSALAKPIAPPPN
jgi:tetratricopeptide (TPR) repeat protein